MLAHLSAQGCIAAVALPRGAPASTAAAPPPAASALDALPPAERRSAEQVEVARHFMINTIKRLLEQNSRLSLTKAIFDRRDAAQLRTHFDAWEAAIGRSWMGRKRLAELRAKLFEVL